LRKTRIPANTAWVHYFLNWGYSHLVLVKNTDATVIDPEIIKENLKLFRKRGYSTDEEETLEGVVAIAVPIKDSNGQVIASISLNDEKSRTSPDKLFGKVDYLMEKALFISRQLGFGDF
jgi:DNA-binding IclR family transcriptional regulator